MRVAMLAPVAWRTPPRAYGPWEAVVHLLTEGLVRRGVGVTLFATADSLTSATLEAVCPAGYAEDPALDAKVMEALHISHCFEQADRFELIHNHFDFLPLSYSGLVRTPLLTTVHGFSSSKILPVYGKYNRRVHYVAISDADRRPGLDYIATIYHGIDLSQFTLRPDPGDYLLFFGRIHDDKGAREAVEIARRSGQRLVVAGIVQDQDYFDRHIAPAVDGDQIVYVGNVGPAERDRLLGGARCLLHPINFDEPFGLSVVEAMACGTPVIARRRGSMPEVIEDGVSGYLVDDIDTAIEALGRVTSLERPACRRHVEQRFGVERMVDDYLRVYARIVGQRV